MSEYFKKLKAAKTDELAKVISDKSDELARQRAQRMSEKVHNLAIQRYDDVIQRYGLDFCIKLGEYAASKNVCGK